MAKVEKIPMQERWIPYASITISAGEWDALRNALNEWEKEIRANGTGLCMAHRSDVLSILGSLRSGA